VHLGGTKKKWRKRGRSIKGGKKVSGQKGEVFGDPRKIRQLLCQGKSEGAEKTKKRGAAKQKTGVDEKKQKVNEKEKIVEIKRVKNGPGRRPGNRHPGDKATKEKKKTTLLGTLVAQTCRAPKGRGTNVDRGEKTGPKTAKGCFEKSKGGTRREIVDNEK